MDKKKKINKSVHTKLVQDLNPNKRTAPNYGGFIL